MTVLLFLAGGLGAASRFVLDGIIRGRKPRRLPWGTAIINISGSLLLGLIAGLAMHSDQPWHAIAGAGFLGGYTTFSTASFGTVRLAQERRYLAAMANGPGILIVAVLAAAAGFWLAA